MIDFTSTLCKLIILFSNQAVYQSGLSQGSHSSIHNGPSLPLSSPELISLSLTLPLISDAITVKLYVETVCHEGSKTGSLPDYFEFIYFPMLVTR